ncbi:MULTISPECIES: hypothetical protein [unclassified Nonomuraea]|uniref:hypothetical protein n=1 Tax=unclassified Nonomuraea TaxID=2593643 RepID=UPI0033EA872F
MAYEGGVNRPEARLIATFVVMGLALSGTFTALLPEGAGDRAAPPPRTPLPATARAAPSPTSIGSMPSCGAWSWARRTGSSPRG